MASLTDHASVRRTDERDLARIAQINAAQFRGNHDDHRTALEWVTCLFGAFPAYQYFVVVVNGIVAGYIGWQIHGGFLRPEPVLELEQLAISQEFENNGLGSRLIRESTRIMLEWMMRCNPRIEIGILVTVWLYADNEPALAAYSKTFTGGVMGERVQYDGKREIMLGLHMPISSTS